LWELFIPNGIEGKESQGNLNGKVIGLGVLLLKVG